MINKLTISPVSNLSAPQVKQSLNDKSGFILCQLDGKDLECIRGLVHEQYLHRIQSVSPQRIADYAQNDMSQYHELYDPDDFKHGEIWSKPSRMLGPRAVAELQRTGFWRGLRQLFGDFQVSDEERFGWPNVYWRLVRPGAEDIGPIHADKWFWDLGHGNMPDGFYRLKVWIALFAEAGKSGLRVVPESQKKGDWRYHSEFKHGKHKPVIDEPEDSLNLLDLPLTAGGSVIFHDKLLHGGMPNFSSSTRASLEFTMFVPESS